jgi:hypothetical protein
VTPSIGYIIGFFVGSILGALIALSLLILADKIINRLSRRRFRK